MVLSKMFALGSEGLSEVECTRGCSTQILHAIPAFTEQLVGTIQGLLHELASRFEPWDTIGHGLKAPDQPLDALQ
jgi:hypothetical protein